MIKKESMCNGCPDCIGCGRRNQYTYTLVCDECWFEIEDYQHAVKIGKNHICEDCIPSYFVTELSAEEFEDDELYEAAIERIVEKNGYALETAESILDEYFNYYEED